MKIGFWSENIESNAAPTRCLREIMSSVDSIEGVEAVHGYKCSSSRYDFKSVESKSAKSFSDKIGADVVHFSRMYDYSYPRRLDTPTILTFHGDVQWEFPKLNYGSYPRLRSAKERLVDLAKIWQFDAVTFPTSDIMERSKIRFKNLLPDSYVVYNAPMPYIEQSFDKSKIEEYGISEPYIFHLSSRSERKNIRNVELAFEEIKDLDVDLIIGGGGWESRDFDNDRIKTVGYIPDEDLKYLYSHAKAFVFPSLHEGFGIPPVESLRCGVVPVVSDRYALPEVTKPESLICDPRDPEDIAEKIREAIKLDIDPRHKYSWDSSAERIVSISESLTD